MLAYEETVVITIHPKTHITYSTMEFTNLSDTVVHVYNGVLLSHKKECI